MRDCDLVNAARAVKKTPQREFPTATFSVWSHSYSSARWREWDRAVREHEQHRRSLERFPEHEPERHNKRIGISLGFVHKILAELAS
jgi:hypothetical protein